MFPCLRRSIALFVVSVLLLGGSLGAGAAQDGSPSAGGDNPFADLGLPEIVLTLSPEAVVGAPSELTAGRYVLAVTNTIPAPPPTLGPPASGVTFVQVPASMTAGDFMAQLAPPPADSGDVASPPAAGPPPAPPAWFYETILTGGPYVLPEQTSFAVIDLAAGEWVVWARSFAAVPAPVAVTVTGEAPADQPAPRATVRVEMTEYAFTFSPDPAAGPQILEVVNVGEQPHFLSVTGVPAGTTTDEVMALFGMGQEPMATPAGDLGFEDLVGVLETTDQSSGVTAWYAANIPAGSNLLACYSPDPGSGVPHAMLGMMQVIEVK